jgi:hypothetical protein
MNVTVQEDPSLWKWNVREGRSSQRDFFEDVTARYVAFVGGMGSGKSYAASRKAGNQMALNAFGLDGQPTYANALMIAEGYQLAHSLNRPQLEDTFREMGLSTKWHGAGVDQYYEMLDLGTRQSPVKFFVRSAERAKSIAGFEVGTVWGDEASRWRSDELDPTNDAFIQGDRRLRQKVKYPQMILSYTNEGEDTLVYKRFEATKREFHSLYRGSTWDNAANLAEGYVEGFVASVSADLVEQYVHGGVAKLGRHLMYYVYDRARNDKPVEAIRGYPLDLSLDFNISPGMHGIVGQFFEKLTPKLATAFDEIHAERMSVRTLVEDFDRKYGERLRNGYFQELRLFGDASGQGDSVNDGTSAWDTVREELKQRRVPFSLHVPKSNPGVIDRVNHVNSAFLTSKGETRYIINERNCPRLAADYRSLKWDTKKKNRGMSHASDAEGYRIVLVLPIRRTVQTTGKVFGAAA